MANLTNRQPVGKETREGYRQPMCSSRVYRGRAWHSNSCQNVATVVYDETTITTSPTRVHPDSGVLEPERTETKIKQVFFCGTHDPDRLAKREQKVRDERQAERDRKEKDRANLKADSDAKGAKVGDLIARLGSGVAQQYRDAALYDHFFTGNVILTAVEVEKLLAELGR